MNRRSAVLLALIAALSVRPAFAFRHLVAGQELPSIALASLGGEPVNLTPASGQKATLIVFWASWSPRSAKALADFQSLYTRFGPADLQVVAINVEHESPDAGELAKAADMARQTGVKYPVAVDRDLSLYGTLGVVAVPSAVLVDGQGKVLELLDGYAPGPSARFVKKVSDVVEAFSGHGGAAGREAATLALRTSGAAGTATDE